MEKDQDRTGERCGSYCVSAGLSGEVQDCPMELMDVLTSWQFLVTLAVIFIVGFAIGMSR